MSTQCWVLEYLLTLHELYLNAMDFVLLIVKRIKLHIGVLL